MMLGPADRSSVSSSRLSEHQEGRTEGRERACNSCRRMKIKCIEKENPPCKRCRTMKIRCSFDREPVVETDSQSRLDALESQMSTVTSKLDELSSLLLQNLKRPRAGRETPRGKVGCEDIFASESRESVMAHHLLPFDFSGSHNALDAFDGDILNRAASTAHHSNPIFTLADSTIPTTPSAPNSTSFDRPSHSDHTVPGVPSRNTSELRSSTPDSEDDDPLDSAVRMEALRTLTNREEAARLRAEGHSMDRAEQSRRRISRRSPDWNGKDPVKRRRLDNTSDHLVLEKGDLSRTFRDPIQLGFCSEEEGQRLFDSFMEKSHCFMPILDRQRDTWSELRRRSAFCTTAALMVASQIADMGRGPSLLTRQCRQQAEQMARVTLFSPVSGLQTVQALVILASWSDVVWRPACHAMTLAVDMGLHRCLPTLHNTHLGAGKSDADLEKDQPLVVGARIWLALTKISYEVAYNHGRPRAFPGDDSLRLGRGLLQHPFSNVFDSRLVVSMELQACRQDLFRPFDLVPSYDRPDIEEKVYALNDVIQGICEYWRGYYQRVDISPDHFLYKELESQRAYAILRTNSLLLHGIRDKHDVNLLSTGRRESIKRVIDAASFLVASIGAGQQSTDSEHGNHYFHVAIVSTARYLIRLAGLLPSACDLQAVSNNLETLLYSLPRFPGYNFAGLLKRDITKARASGILPRPNTMDMTSALSDIPSVNSHDMAPIATESGWSSWLSSGLPGSGFESLVGNGVGAEIAPLSWWNSLEFSQVSQPWFELDPTSITGQDYFQGIDLGNQTDL